jgi:hypothetical protein
MTTIKKAMSLTAAMTITLWLLIILNAEYVI